MLILGLVDVPLWLLLFIFIFITLYWLSTWNHGYFQKQGISGPRPLPFIGTIYTFFTGGNDVYNIDRKMREKFGNTFGMFTGNMPEFITFDEEMITEVAVKQFHNFTDRRNDVFREPALVHNVLVLKGERWKYVRSQMSPTFTTGKLRKMSAEINRSAKSFAKRIIATGGEPFETNSCTDAFTMDCIASTGFGLRVNSQGEESNEFNINGKKILDFNLKSIRYLVNLLCPDVLINTLEYLGVNLSLMNQDGIGFFRNVFDQTFKGRAAEDKSRVDFLQLMVKAQQGENINDPDGTEEVDEDNVNEAGKMGLTKEEILSNALIFFMAGFHTVSLGLTQLIYQLACNQECQQKLIDEVDSIIGDGETTYDAVMKLNYIEQCINESLRIYPPAIRIGRKAVADTEVGGVKIEKGMIVVFPALAIHRDPEIWPEPMKFDPERFSPERRGSIKPTHWMPFGYGPRNCIGMRQALFEIKAAIIEVLKTHRFITCEKTEIPLTMSKSKHMKAENGVWISVEPRNMEKQQT